MMSVKAMVNDLIIIILKSMTGYGMAAQKDHSGLLFT